ncbi:MAG: ABC transporter ATP-binding protein [Bacteroidia bacterium]
MLKVENIAFSYSQETSFDFPNFELKQGEQSLLIGESGSGKTTLLHLLAGFTKAKAGDIFVADTNISKLKNAALDSFRGQNIGFVFQKPLFIQSLNVAENILMAQHLGSKKTDLFAIKQTLKKLGLEDKLNAQVNTLSEGEKQRVNIARALINSPKVIFADEPTSALDDTNCKAVIELLKGVAKEYNSTLLVVTHDNRLKQEFNRSIELKK